VFYGTAITLYKFFFSRCDVSFGIVAEEVIALLDSVE
jgi:hypothetical protein